MRTIENAATPTGAVKHLPAGVAAFESVCEVAPGSRSEVERRPEMVLSFVLSGSALVEVSSGIVRIGQGGSALFESMETHVFHNDSADTPLVVVTAHWMPLSAERASRLDDQPATVTTAGYNSAA